MLCGSWLTKALQNYIFPPKWPKLFPLFYSLSLFSCIKLLSPLYLSPSFALIDGKFRAFPPHPAQFSPIRTAVFPYKDCNPKGEDCNPKGEDCSPKGRTAPRTMISKRIP